MSKLYLLPFFTLMVSSLYGQDIQFPPSGENQRASVSQNIGLVKVMIEYSRPNVTGPNGEDRKGKIWGNLIPFGLDKGLPWRAGANERTTIEFSHDVLINDNKLNKGKYGLLIYVESDESWTIIFSKEHSGWGQFGYKKENDALRIKCTPTETTLTEWLTYGFDNPLLTGATVFLKWETRKIEFQVNVPDPKSLYVEHFREALKKPSVFFYSSNWEWAANYCADNDVNLEEALQWANRSMAPGIGVPTYSALSTKAKILKKLNRNEEAKSEMDKAVRSSTATAGNIDSYARALLAENDLAGALAIFRLNETSNPGEKFITSLGLADYYASAKDRRQEKIYLERAIQSINETQKTRKEQLQLRLSALK